MGYTRREWQHYFLMNIERYEENIALGEMQFNIQLEIERRRN